MEDTFNIIVEFTAGEGQFSASTQLTHVQVLASSINEASLTAMQMVACRGRCPVNFEIDWDNF